MTPLILSYLSEVSKREEAATGGPWKTSRCKEEGWSAFKKITGYQRAVKYRDFVRDFDADFIAHSRQDVYILHSMVTDLLEIIHENKINGHQVHWLIERFTEKIEGDK